MDEIRLLVKLDQEPLEKDKAIIKEFLTSMLAQLSISGEVQVETRVGSWEFIAWAPLKAGSIFLFNQFSGWLINKGFDQGWKSLKDASARKPLMPNQDASSVADIQLDVVLKGFEANEQDIAKGFEGLYKIRESLPFPKSEKSEISAGRWLNEQNRGVVFRLTKDPKFMDEKDPNFMDEADKVENSCSIMMFESKDDFISFYK